ncbi:MAG TPA: molybdopterin-binding protein [Actinomycetota bacterium]
MDVAVVVVGDEILAGHVRERNAHFIAERLHEHGHALRRVVVVPDDPAEIAGEVRVSRSLAWMVVVCGGLGPTHDDRTMEGVALALGRPLAICDALAERIDALVSEIGAAGFGGEEFGAGGLRKMAMAPAGAEMLETPSGVLPAVVVEEGPGPVVILPGPPRALQLVWAEAVEDRYLRGTGAELLTVEVAHPYPESTVAELLKDLQERYPGTSIGSYPQRERSLVRIKGPHEDVSAVERSVREHLAALDESEAGRRFRAFVDERRAKLPPV